MRSSNLIKVTIISIFTALAIGCSKGDKDSGSDSTWSPRNIDELRDEIQNYKVMSEEKYENEKVMQSRTEYIENLFGDDISMSFADILNNDYDYKSAIVNGQYKPSKDKAFVEEANRFIMMNLSVAFNRPIVDHTKDLQTRHDEDRYRGVMSPQDSTSIVAQLTEIVGNLKRTQSNGESYWGPRDTKRVAYINHLIQERKEDEIAAQQFQRAAGFTAVALVGGTVAVVLPKVAQRSFWQSFHRIGDFITAPLGKLLGRDKSTPDQIVKFSNHQGMLTKSIKFLWRYSTLKGTERIHFTNAVKIRHHFSNLLYSIKKQNPHDETVQKLKKGMNNVAFTPRFGAAEATPEDAAIQYFATAHRVSNEQYFNQELFGTLYKNAIQDIDLTKAQRTEFKRQFSKLVSENSEVGAKFKDLAVDTERSHLFAQKSMRHFESYRPKTKKRFGEYGEDLPEAWSPTTIPQTEVVYTDALLKRLVTLRQNASDLDKPFLDQAIELVYKHQKYDVLNVGSMKLILKKNKGEVEKVFVSRPVSFSQTTTFELSTKQLNENTTKPLKPSSVSQEEFLNFMDKTVRSIREDQLLTPVLGTGPMGPMTVGYMSLTKKVRPAMVAQAANKNHDEMFNFTKNAEDATKGWLARKAKKFVNKPANKVKAFFRSGDNSLVSEAGNKWAKRLIGKPGNVDKMIDLINDKIEVQIKQFVKAVDEIPESRLDKGMRFSELESHELRVQAIMGAIEDIDKYPYATSLKISLQDALKEKSHVDLDVVKAFLKENAPDHIKGQSDNMKFVGTLLKNDEFLAMTLKKTAFNGELTEDALRVYYKNENVPGLTKTQAEERLLMDIYFSVNQALREHFNSIFKVANEKNHVQYHELFEAESVYWIPGFYQRNIKDMLKWTDKKWANWAIALTSTLGFAGLMDSLDVPGLNSGIFIDDSVNAVNWQAVTESSEYRAFKGFGAEGYEVEEE